MAEKKELWIDPEKPLEEYTQEELIARCDKRIRTIIIPYVMHVHNLKRKKLLGELPPNLEIIHKSEEVINKKKGTPPTFSGTRWIHSEVEQVNKRVPINDLSFWLQNGWKIGAIAKK